MVIYTDIVNYIKPLILKTKRKTFFKNFSQYLFILGLLFFGFKVLINTTLYAATFSTGQNISVPISFSASDNVSAMEFNVNVSGGSLVGLRCGGSGFSNISSGGNKCVIANLGGGAKSGVVGTATVRSNTPGTINVTAGGSLSNSSGGSVGGGFSGATHTIVQGVAQPAETKPAATNPETMLNTSDVGSEKVPQTLLKVKDGRQFDAKQKTIFEKTLNIDNQVTDVIFSKNWDIPEDATLVITSPDPVILDFSELKKPVLEDDIATVFEIKKGFNVDRSNSYGNTLVQFPSNSKMTSFGFFGNSEEWDGKLSAPEILNSTKILEKEGVVNFMVSVGSNDNVLVFDSPVKLVLYGQTGMPVAYKQLGISSRITDTCIANEKGEYSLGESAECYYDDGYNITILTKHFTTFYTFYDYSINNLPQILRHPQFRYKVVVYGLSAAFGLVVILMYVHFREKIKIKRNNNVPRI